MDTRWLESIQLRISRATERDKPIRDREPWQTGTMKVKPFWRCSTGSILFDQQELQIRKTHGSGLSEYFHTAEKSLKFLLTAWPSAIRTL
jgi:hypothetical protein